MRADVTKVRQILFNLLSNACKFTDHGTISVDVDQIRVEERDWIQFRVSDTGIGISAKQKENLFQEFAQADASIARKRSEEHTSELQSPDHLVCRLLLEKKKRQITSAAQVTA